MNRLLGVFAVVLLFFSLVFAFSALLSQMKSFPSAPSCMGVAKVCAAMFTKYESTLKADAYLVYLFQSYAALAEGFAAASLLSFLFVLRRFKRSWLDRPLGIPKSARLLGGIVAVVGGSVFVFRIVVGDWLDKANWHDYVLGTQTFTRIEMGQFTNGTAYGILSMEALLIGAAGFALFRLHRGLWMALRDVLTRFLAPLGLLFMAGILFFFRFGMI